MGPLAETSAHARSQTYAGLAEFVAQAVGSGHRVFPALLAIALEQVDLIGLRGERRCLHAQKADGYSFFPILAEERADLLENLGVELGCGCESVGAG